MKVSPYSLLQEELCHDPWKLLVACMLLNQTSYKQVRGVIWKLFERYPTAVALSNADETELSALIRPLGFHNRRAKSLRRMSCDFAAGKRIDELHGIGQYARDSYAMFVEGRADETQPTDVKLVMWKAWWATQ